MTTKASHAQLATAIEWLRIWTREESACGRVALLSITCDRVRCELINSRGYTVASHDQGEAWNDPVTETCAAVTLTMRKAGVS
jgi:hypothetical protein